MNKGKKHNISFIISSADFAATITGDAACGFGATTRLPAMRSRIAYGE